MAYKTWSWKWVKIQKLLDTARNIELEMGKGPNAYRRCRIDLPPLPPGKSEIDVAADYLFKLQGIALEMGKGPNASGRCTRHRFGNG